MTKLFLNKAFLTKGPVGGHVVAEVKPCVGLIIFASY